MKEIKTKEEIKSLYIQKYGDAELCTEKYIGQKALDRLKARVKEQCLPDGVENEINTLWNNLDSAKEDDKAIIKFLLCFYFDIYDEMINNAEQKL